MAWVRIDDGFTEHRKILGLSDPAFRLHVHALCYANRALTNGVVPFVWLTGGRGRKVPKVVNELVAANVWEHREDGDYQIHDYLAFQPSRDEISESRDRMTIARAEAGRKGGLAKASKTVANGKQNGKQTCSKPLANVSSKPVAPSHPIPSHPIPESSDPTTSHPSAAPSSPSSPLIVSSLAFEKARKTFTFYGSRLKVPHVLHAELRDKLGGESPHERLVAWYDELNTTAEITREPIVDVFDWLRPKFKEWAGEQIASAEIEKFRPKGA